MLRLELSIGEAVNLMRLIRIARGCRLEPEMVSFLGEFQASLSEQAGIYFQRLADEVDVKKSMGVARVH